MQFESLKDCALFYIPSFTYKYVVYSISFQTVFCTGI